MPEFKKVSTQGLFTQYQARLTDFLRDLLILIEDVLTNLGNILNRGLSFEDNFDSQELSYTSNATPNTEDAIPHTLGRIPDKFIVVNLDKGGVVYRSATAATKTNIYLKCTTGSTALNVLIF